MAPGNAGTRGPVGSLPHLRELEGKRIWNVGEDAPLLIAKRENVDLVVVGPDGPLCAGLVDELTREGVLTYGPSKLAAELEEFLRRQREND